MTSTAATDLIFGLTRVVGLPALTEKAGAPLGADDIAQIITEADRFCTEVLQPDALAADRAGATYANGLVKTPPSYPAAYAKWVEGGWQSLSAPEAQGGQGLPAALWTAMVELGMAADTSFMLGPLLTAGAIECLVHYATPDQAAKWLPKMVSGEWTGAMCLTEPNAGSDLGVLRTRAEPLGNGRYALHGQKIFITWGEHDCTDNIVYLVLARLPDAPPGSRGISLFVATKLKEDGSRNELRCGGIEHKLGIHGSPTCVMLFEGAEAELVGEPHRGLNAMFAMMNNARLGVGTQGVAHGAASLRLAEAYAADRVQGGGKPIAEHPDVQRMLMEMRAVTLAGRLMALETAICVDRHAMFGDEAAQARLALLTPILKAWATDRGVETASTGVQVHGGMGFIEETGAARILRDARIAPIYEGTNGIQAIDLLVRKVAKDGGAEMRSLLAEVKRNPDARLRAAAERLEAATALVLDTQGRDADAAQSIAVPYLEAAGWLIGGWMLARAAAEDSAHYGELAEFYLRRLLPRSGGRIAEIEGALAA